MLKIFRTIVFLYRRKFKKLKFNIGDIVQGKLKTGLKNYRYKIVDIKYISNVGLQYTLEKHSSKKKNSWKPSKFKEEHREYLSSLKKYYVKLENPYS